MEALEIRSLQLRDWVAVKQIARNWERLEMPQLAPVAVPVSNRAALATFVPSKQRDRVFLAEIDHVPRALLVVRPCPELHRWELLAFAVDDVLLTQDAAIVNYMRTAMLEFAIGAAGSQGIKRLFAAAEQDSGTLQELTRIGFEPFCAYRIIGGTLPTGPRKVPAGMRCQEDADIWSIHRLYHQLIPQAVQFAEALPSEHWSCRRRSMVARWSDPTPDSQGFVVSTPDGVRAHCLLQQRGSSVTVQLMVADELRGDAVGIVQAAGRLAGLSDATPLLLLLPTYALETVTAFEAVGFEPIEERVATVRLTTVAARVKGHVVPSLEELVEAVPRGVPSYANHHHPFRHILDRRSEQTRTELEQI